MLLRTPRVSWIMKRAVVAITQVLEDKVTTKAALRDPIVLPAELEDV